ncbi:MAG: hypothetical protein V1874_16680 [Spirochaetota bacterium]
MKKSILTNLFLFLFVFTGFSVFAEEMTDKKETSKFSIMADAGFGWSNNLRTEDWLNAYRNLAKANFNPGYQEKEEKSTLIYGGFDLEPRYYTGNIVYGVSIGYHKTTTGKRELTGTQIATTNPLSYKAEASLSMFSVMSTIYYKINKSDTSFLLLGGGLGYYRATLKLKEGFNTNINSYKGNGWTIGWHTQIEYNKTFGNVVLAGGVMSRFAEVWKLEINDSSGNEKYDSSVNMTGIYFYIGAGYLI